MSWIVVAIVSLALLVTAGILILRRSVARFAERTKRDGVLEEFDAGLAIPMRDADTRRGAKERP